MEKGRRLQKNGKRIRWSSIDNYLFLLKHLQDYSSQKQIRLRIRDWDELNARAKKTEINYWKNFYHTFTEYLFNDKGHYDNYVGANIKMLRAFFSYLKNKIIVNPGPFYNYFYILMTKARISQ